MPADHGAMAAALVEAFRDDPFMSWLFPDGEGRARPDALDPFMAAEVAGHQPHGHAYVDDERAVALWIPPGGQSDQSGVAAVMAEHAEPERIAIAGDGFVRMLDHHPGEPYFYLSMLGSRDDSRGQGLGSALLRRVLDTCDREGLAAHLESSNARNVGLYERHGFTVEAEIEFAAGVVLRPMTRPPQ